MKNLTVIVVNYITINRRSFKENVSHKKRAYSMAKRKNQAEHVSMVKSIANYLSSKGFSAIKADLPDQSQPDLIYWEKTKKGHVPDVTATLNNQNYIFEVETDDSVNDEHTEDQWTLFAANAKQYSKQFIVVVPKGSETKAHQRLEELKISANDIWTVS
jgi:hypothetical protein